MNETVFRKRENRSRRVREARDAENKADKRE